MFLTQQIAQRFSFVITFQSSLIAPRSHVHNVEAFEPNALFSNIASNTARNVWK